MNKALFLDRDGVINIEKNYLHKIEDFEFTEGIFSLCRRFSEAGYSIVVVTNQSGIARKMYSEEDFNQLTLWMNAQFLQKGIVIDKVYHCPHHPDITGVCECRKPKPQMLLEAQKLLDIDMSLSVMVGDKERDIEAGINANVQRNYLFTHEDISTKANKRVTSLDEIEV